MFSVSGSVPVVPVWTASRNSRWWLHGHRDGTPPAEFEAAFYAVQQTAPTGVRNQQPESPSDPGRFRACTATASNKVCATVSTTANPAVLNYSQILQDCTIRFPARCLGMSFSGW